MSQQYIAIQHDKFSFLDKHLFRIFAYIQKHSFMTNKMMAIKGYLKKELRMSEGKIAQGLEQLISAKLIKKVPCGNSFQYISILDTSKFTQNYRKAKKDYNDAIKTCNLSKIKQLWHFGWLSIPENIFSNKNLNHAEFRVYSFVLSWDNAINNIKKDNQSFNISELGLTSKDFYSSLLMKKKTWLIIMQSLASKGIIIPEWIYKPKKRHISGVAKKCPKVPKVHSGGTKGTFQGSQEVHSGGTLSIKENNNNNNKDSVTEHKPLEGDEVRPLNGHLTPKKDFDLVKGENHSDTINNSLKDLLDILDESISLDKVSNYSLLT